MKPSTKTILLILAILLLILGIAATFTKCSERRSQDAVDTHKDNLASIINLDSLNNAWCARERKMLDSLDTKHAKDLEDTRAYYQSLQSKEQEVVIKWRDRPIIPECAPIEKLCDTLMAVKDEKIRTLELLDSQNVNYRGILTRKISVGDSLITLKNGTIEALQAGYGKVIADLEKASKPKRIVGSVGVGYGISGNRLQPYAGVQIGYKLFQF